MIEYLDYTERVDTQLQNENLRIWRRFTLTNGRPIGLYASGERGAFGAVSLHFFLTYIKSATPDDLERYSLDCLEYALKACQLPLAKQMLTSCLILPCLATHTTFRELVLAAEKARKLSKEEQKIFQEGRQNSFLQTVIMPCLLNLTNHRCFHSGAGKSFNELVLKVGEEFFIKTVVSCNTEKETDSHHR